jgi:hypothetical protein
VSFVRRGWKRILIRKYGCKIIEGDKSVGFRRADVVDTGPKSGDPGKAVIWKLGESAV